MLWALSFIPKFLFIKRNGIFYHFQSHSLVLKFFHLYGLIFKFFIFLKEMPKLVKKMFGQLFNIVIVVHTGIFGCYCNDLIVTVAIVDHLHNAKHFSFHQAEWNN